MHAPRTITITADTWTKTMKFTPATDEQFVIKEVFIDECYAFDFNKDDVVLNLGGNIGAFDVFAFDRVKKIVTFEPNQELLNKIVYHFYLNRIQNSELHGTAIARHDGEIPFCIGDNAGHNSCVGPTNTKVECEDIERVFKEQDFTKIKCDIEGYEYVLFRGLTIPETVNEIWMETHLFSEEAKESEKVLIQELLAQSFTCTVIQNDPEGLERTHLLHFQR